MLCTWYLGLSVGLSAIPWPALPVPLSLLIQGDPATNTIREMATSWPERAVYWVVISFLYWRLEKHVSISTERLVTSYQAQSAAAMKLQEAVQVLKEIPEKLGESQERYVEFEKNLTASMQNLSSTVAMLQQQIQYGKPLQPPLQDRQPRGGGSRS